MITRYLTLAAVLMAANLAAACNTTKGAGEDIEATGEAVQDTAQKTEDRLER